jgi:hypothetical protein
MVVEGLTKKMGSLGEQIALVESNVIEMARTTATFATQTAPLLTGRLVQLDPLDKGFTEGVGEGDM